METQHLRDLLKQLHAELERADSVDEESRAILRNVMDDIHEVLDKEGGVEQEGEEEQRPVEEFRERLEDALRRFEVRHPRITSGISQVLDALPK